MGKCRPPFVSILVIEAVFVIFFKLCNDVGRFISQFSISKRDMSDYYSGYSLHQRNGSVPMMSMNDWMNPMQMFPSMQNQNFFKGAPVRAPEAPHRSERKTEIDQRPKQKSPCSNVPSRTLKRMQMFEARDWTTFQAPVMAVQPIDAALPYPAPQVEAPKTSLWQPTLSVQQQYSHNTWLKSSKNVASPKGLVAIGEVSDSDSGKEDEAEHEQWMKELLATVNSVMTDHEGEAPVANSIPDTQTHFQFEWLHQAKRGGVDLHSQ